ncbi:MHYT domain-containing protein, partial [Pseudomonas aeruginosa]|uniref:MHYT domain-containing protein n=1 Tax=Pseudomonas aeruginosa TaxID=287 RepID=UPI000BDB7491
GSGIAAMHYTGMAALLMMPGIVYDPLWLGLSILIAVIASGAAGRGIDNGWLAVLVIVITLAVIAIALIVSVLDSRLEARTS